MDTLLRQAAQDIVSILQNPPKPLPYLNAGDETKNALLQIATLLQRATKPPQINTLPAPTPKPASPVPTLIPNIPASLPRVQLPNRILPPPSSHRMVLRGHPTPPRVQPILTHAAPPRVQAVTPQQVPLTPDRRPPVQVTQHISAQNAPVLSTYHPTMVSFRKVKKRNRPQRQKRPSIAHVPYEDLIHRIPLPKMTGSFPSKTSLLQKQANASFLYPAINHIYRKDGKKETITSLRHGPEKDRWNRALSNEIGRLAQGNKYGIKGTDTIEFIRREHVPRDRDITYASFVCDHRPLKTENGGSDVLLEVTDSHIRTTPLLRQLTFSTPSFS